MEMSTTKKAVYFTDKQALELADMLYKRRHGKMLAMYIADLLDEAAGEQFARIRHDIQAHHKEE